MKKYTKHKQQGFTIIELMIATTIFSLILMICLAAIMSITRMYYQGTLQARTQNRVREIVDEVADEIRYQPGELVTTTSPIALSGDIELDDGTIGAVDPREPHDYHGQHCVGSIRYRYILGFKTANGAQLASSPTDDRDARGTLVRETIPGGCALTLDNNDDVKDELLENTDVVSMLDEKMRLLEFDISPSGSSTNRYKVAVTVAYGDDDLIEYDSGRYQCRPDNVARAYCAVSRLELLVTRRFK